jgi:hypothetical protein
MFVRKKGKYHYLVESCREGGKVRHRTLAYLGSADTIAGAIAEAEHGLRWCEQHRKPEAELSLFRDWLAERKREQFDALSKVRWFRQACRRRRNGPKRRWDERLNQKLYEEERTRKLRVDSLEARLARLRPLMATAPPAVAGDREAAEAAVAQHEAAQA